LKRAPGHPGFEAMVRDTFRRQRVMETLGASLTRISPGSAEIRAPIRGSFAGWDGSLHTGLIASMLDSACGYATISLSPPGGAVLAVEFKINFLSPARGDAFVARAAVERTSGGLATCTAEGHSVSGGVERLVATMLSTIMIVLRPGR
jgi:uncharacterized protein (TIGR00369 family)